MKKVLALVLALALVVCAIPALAEEVAVMTKEEFDKAAIDDPVCVEAYVQGNQSWWDGKIKLYLQDDNQAAYFVYDMPCTE